MRRILLVDDSPVEHVRFSRLLTAGKPPIMRHTEIICELSLLPEMKDYRAFDAVFFDHFLSAPSPRSGYDEIVRLHMHDWRIPSVLITGEHPKNLPPDVLQWAHYVCSKMPNADGWSSIYDTANVARAIQRTLAMKDN